MLLPDENKQMTRDWRRQFLQENDKKKTKRCTGVNLWIRERG